MNEKKQVEVGINYGMNYDHYDVDLEILHHGEGKWEFYKDTGRQFIITVDPELKGIGAWLSEANCYLAWDKLPEEVRSKAMQWSCDDLQEKLIQA